MIVNTWQACPVCANKPPAITHCCSTCKGTKLISLMTGKPPQDIPYNVPYNANSTLGIIQYVNEI